MMVSTERIHRLSRTSRDKLVWCLQKMLRLDGTSHNKLVKFLHREFIGYTRLVVIN
jgi:hypothetical protein